MNTKKEREILLWRLVRGRLYECLFFDDGPKYMGILAVELGQKEEIKGHLRSLPPKAWK
jgi:hypothetical protein